MSAQSIQPPFTIFQGIDGNPLESGYIYIGTAGLDASANQITVYWDSALTSAAAQPIRTAGGYPMNSGSPGVIYTGADDFSILVNDKNSSTVVTALNKTQFISSASVGYTSSLTGGIERTLSSKLGDIVSVKDFGAVGDGVADDTAAIQAAIDAVKAVGYGGTIYFPRGEYRITATITASLLAGVKFMGEMASVNAGPTIADAVNDARIFWDGTNNTDPMFYFYAGHNNSFENLTIHGMTGSDGTYRAYAGVWIDYNHENYRFYQCKFALCSIGIRVCSSYNHTTTAWTPGYTQYPSANGNYSSAAESVGGYASDNGKYEDCTFGYCTIAGVSIESAQALTMSFIKSLFSNNEYAIRIPACQGATIDSNTFLSSITSDISCIGQASTGNIYVVGAHTEGGGQILFEFDNQAAAMGKGIVIQSCGGGDVNIDAFSGTMTIKNSTLRTVSMKRDNTSLIIEDCTIASLDKTASLGTGPFLRMSNVDVTGTLTTNAFNYDVLQIAGSSFPTFTALAKVAQRFSSAGFLPDLLIGPTAGNSSVLGLDGVAFYGEASACIISWGAYLTEAGVWTASATTGGNISFTSTGFTVNMFSGATINTTPTFVKIFSSNTQDGVYLPQLAAEPSATPGTMYYDTATSKVRIRDGAGWRDF